MLLYCVYLYATLQYTNMCITAFYTLFLFSLSLSFLGAVVVWLFLCFIHPQGGRHLWLPSSCWVDEMAIKNIQNTQSLFLFFLLFFFFFCSSSIGFLRCDSFLFLTKNLFFDFLMTVVICGSRELWPKMGRKKTREIGRRDTTRCFHSPLFLVLFFHFLFFLALYDAMQRMTGAAKRRILRPASHHPRKEKRRRKTLRRRPGHNQI